MAIHQGPYVGARSCTGGPQDGAKALMAWFLGAYPDGKNLGIYNCRSVRGGSTTSLHGEGRAVDLGHDVGEGWVDDLADLLRLNSAALGIQCIITERRIWSNRYPNQGWRPYNGPNPHTDHLHVELTWSAARSLTAADIHAVLSTKPAAPAPRPQPVQKPAAATGMEQYMRTVDLRNAHRSLVTGRGVKQLQALLLAAGYGPSGLVGRNGKPDGKAGAMTRKYLGQYQIRTRTGRPNGTADYIAGKNTNRALVEGR